MNNHQIVRQIILITSLIFIGACTSLNEPEKIVDETITLRNYEYEGPDYADIPKGTPRPTYSYVDFDQEDSFLDLDTGMQTNNGDADLYYFLSCGSRCYSNFLFFQDTISVVAGFTEPGYEGCKYGLFELGKDNIGIWVREGYFTCLLTNEGRISQIRVNKYHFDQDQAVIELDVITWDPVIEVSE